MKESEFNKKRDELIINIHNQESFIDKMKAWCKFENFMMTKSHNGYWNPKYRKNIYLLLPNEIKVPFY